MFKRLFMALCLTVFTLCGLSAKTYIVAAGITDYPGTENDLRFPADDARAFVNLYKSKGAQCELLTNSQATRANINKAFQRVYSQAGRDDTVIFFFSGHGMPGYFVAYDDTMPYSEVRDGMKKGGAKTKLIFADACYAGKLGDGRRGESTSTTKKADVMLFLSSRPSETSLDGTPDMGNGLFTYYLLQGLKGKADKNRNRTITAAELYKYVHDNVIRFANNVGHSQHPQMIGKFPTTMPVIKW